MCARVRGIVYLDGWDERSFSDHPQAGRAYEILKRLPDYEEFIAPEKQTLALVAELLAERIGGGAAIVSYAIKQHWRTESERTSTAVRIGCWQHGVPALDDFTLAIRCWEAMPIQSMEIRKHIKQMDALSLDTACVFFNVSIAGKFPDHADHSRSLREALNLLFGRNGLIGSNPKPLLAWATENMDIPEDINIPKLAGRIIGWKQGHSCTPSLRQIQFLADLIDAVVLEELPPAPRHGGRISKIHRHLAGSNSSIINP